MSSGKLHVLFSPSAAGTLQNALSQAGREDRIACLFDDLSFGPIASSDPQVRVRWVEETLGYAWEDVASRNPAFLSEARSATSALTAWVSTKSAKCLAGFQWWLSHFGDAPCSIVESDAVFLLNPHQMIALSDQGTPLAADERAKHQGHWRRLVSENAPLRVVDGSALVSASLTHFDQTLLSFATKDWRKSALIVGKTLAQFAEHGAYQAGDLLLHARLIELADSGALEWRGELGQMQNSEMRLP